MVKQNQFVGGIEFYPVRRDANGNPRYVVHYLAFSSNYDIAKIMANRLGFRVYRGKDFGGGFVCQSYSLKDTASHILALREKRIAELNSD